MTPPDLIPFTAYGGDWTAYETELHRIFIAEMAHGGLTFRGVRVTCRRVPEAAGRWASFWHLVQEGHVEDDRTPDLRRCERIRWVRWVDPKRADTCRDRRMEEYARHRGEHAALVPRGISGGSREAPRLLAVENGLLHRKER